MAISRHVQSEYLKVFPISTPRKSNTGARMLTELNIASLMNAVNSYNSFVISENLSDVLFEFMICGYYFAISNAELQRIIPELSVTEEEVTEVYASIYLLSEHEEKARILGADIAESDNESFHYSGLYISANPDALPYPESDKAMLHSENETVTRKDLLILVRSASSNEFIVPEECRNINDVLDGGFID